MQRWMLISCVHAHLFDVGFCSTLLLLPYRHAYWCFGSVLWLPFGTLHCFLHRLYDGVLSVQNIIWISPFWIWVNLYFAFGSSLPQLLIQSESLMMVSPYYCISISCVYDLWSLISTLPSSYPCRFIFSFFLSSFEGHYSMTIAVSVMPQILLALSCANCATVSGCWVWRSWRGQIP